MRLRLIAAFAIPAAFLIAWVWLAGASLMLCSLTHRWDQFVWPFNVWLEEVRGWGSLSGLLKFDVALSGIGPTMPIFAIVYRLACSGARQIKPGKLLGRSLYGDSGWADAAEQRANGVRQSAKL
jgi:hypothetical protein